MTAFFRNLPEYESIELKEGDEIRWILPYAGG